MIQSQRYTFHFPPSRPPQQEKKNEKIKNASKKISVSKIKTIRDGVVKAHTAQEQRRKAGKIGTGQREEKVQQQFLCLLFQFVMFVCFCACLSVYTAVK